jgi:phage FluMu gp28-like protein
MAKKANITKPVRVFDLLAYQAAWVRDNAPVKVVEKGRRIGISWAEAYDDTLHALAGRGSIYYQSYSYDNAKGFIRDCVYWLGVIGKFEAAIEEYSFIDADPLDPKAESVNVSAAKIELPNGKEIVAMTSAPRQFRSRGRAGDRAVVDEAAFVNDVDEVIKSALAFVIWGGSVRIISTHNGVANPFNRLIEDIRDERLNYSLHTIPFDDAVDQGLMRRTLEVINSAAPANKQRPINDNAERELYNQIFEIYKANAAEELQCIPAAGSGAYFDRQDIRANMKSDCGDPALYAGGLCYVGVDLARTRHKWVVYVGEDINGRLIVREKITLSDASKANQDAAIKGIFARYKIAKLKADATGMGMGYVEGWQSDIDRNRIDAVTFTTSVRLYMADLLRTWFEDRRIDLDDDTSLLDDAALFRTKITPTGTTQLIVDENANGHGDAIWALALMVAAAAEGGIEPAGMTIGRASGNDDLDDLDDEQDLRGRMIGRRPLTAR